MLHELWLCLLKFVFTNSFMCIFKFCFAFRHSADKLDYQVGSRTAWCTQGNGSRDKLAVLERAKRIFKLGRHSINGQITDNACLRIDFRRRASEITGCFDFVEQFYPFGL